LDRIRDAAKFGSACPQSASGNGPEVLDEDRLFVNVFRPTAAIDGNVLAQDSVDLLKQGALNGIDVIIGTVADERTAHRARTWNYQLSRPTGKSC
jgi:carboxylesterase type B